MAMTRNDKTANFFSEKNEDDEEEFDLDAGEEKKEKEKEKEKEKVKRIERISEQDCEELISVTFAFLFPNTSYLLFYS
tara:strand:+ start:554 stop:787 length:234 start_codon:yes stop_codon:yes gene_type:complete